MCNHVFSYPPDTRENYNPDGETLTGICKYCGIIRKSYGMQWSISREESFRKLDPLGEIRIRFVYEKDLPNKYIHNPTEAPIDVLRKANIVLGENYPKEIVDHRLARNRALRLYKKI